MVYTHNCPCFYIRGGEGGEGRGGEGRGGVLVHPTAKSGRVEVALRGEEWVELCKWFVCEGRGGEGRGGYM